MKTRIKFFACFILVVAGTNLWSQPISVGTKWYYGYLNELPCEYNYQLYEIIKDTIIQNKTCYVMEGSSHLHNQKPVIFPVKEIIYQEEGKVYIFKNDNFHVLFDYKAHVGDTITVLDEEFDGIFASFEETLGPSTLFQYVVINTDTLLIDNIAYKRLYILSTDSSDWVFDGVTEIVENIGRISGDYAYPLVFGNPIDIGSIFYGICDLRCFNDISFVDYPCDNLGAVNSIQTRNSPQNLYFYPNVLTDNIIFKRNIEIARIYNLYGIKVMEIQDISEGEYNINSLNQGIYILQINNNNESLTFQVIKK